MGNKAKGSSKKPKGTQGRKNIHNVAQRSAPSRISAVPTMKRMKMRVTKCMADTREDIRVSDGM